MKPVFWHWAGCIATSADVSYITIDRGAKPLCTGISEPLASVVDFGMKFLVQWSIVRVHHFTRIRAPGSPVPEFFLNIAPQFPVPLVLMFLSGVLA